MSETEVGTVELLAKVPLLQELNPEDFERLAAAVTVQDVPANSSVVEIGDAGRALFILVEGEVQVRYPSRSADFELARLGPGDFFGEMALLNDRPRSATVRTVTDAKLLVLDQDDFRDLLLSSPPAAVRLLKTLSLRIRNADEQISTLSDRAMQDSLTGLLNRRAFHERMNQEIDRTLRYGDGFSLILLDVDHFRTINESFSHDVGDAVLRWLGRLFVEHTRAADIPFRIGGEEFAILAPATEGEVAGIAAERLVRMVDEAQPPLEFDLALTITAGYASCPSDTESPAELYTIASEALQRARETGRNRVGHPVKQ